MFFQTSDSLISIGGLNYQILVGACIQCNSATLAPDQMEFTPELHISSAF